mmetsp:Transcript_5787/g.10034  ORF Transcript_5787/g.10034 Transcript_5787/m.10034 type:complete len:512 (-) Transcript_5787:461-1996(-)|eukprot:CAMPEP_0119106116 /NCGR_PEP_ID=MMETSP1180-20130426/3899_1 /TAXON_ID=3052 ORGANISM="Chlamydomonas cf sp, Strain CCMP681" /NCGR_SAMPLE_ID=MMETSP1180 /ASSEMBLY_ACC=CAM_ASM_000741 /LENGTH=511 /DNA_ID=CAMNT_0007091365 /DNA_START=67 /DNA_END=1602 /DNA_ORIENTATION=+
MSTAEHSGPAWFTPIRLLTIFCGVNLFVYLDRGLIASNGVNGTPRTEEEPEGSGIQGEFGLTLFQDGLLPAAFMIGLLLSSPFFAEVCKQYSAFRLLGIGMGIWSTACICCGLAPNYWTFMLARVFVGVGEASFVALAAPFIDDFAPVRMKAQWFAAFFLCIPVGFACGYIVGGLVAPALGWRAAFIGEGAVIVPFVIFALRAQPLHLAGTHDEGQTQKGSSTVVTHAHGSSLWTRLASHVKVFMTDVRIVVNQRVWVLACIGYTSYVAVLGCYAYWGPKAGKALYFRESSGEQADLVFGGVTVVTGVVGSLAGGFLLDRMGSSLRSANLICAGAVGLGLLVLLPAFLATKTFTQFMAAFAAGQLLIFMLQAPAVAVQMWCVPPVLRPLGASLTTVCIHLLGDVPSPPALGWLQSRLSEGKTPAEAAQMWRVSLSLLSLLLLVAGVFFWAAACASVPGADYRVPPHTHLVGDQEALLSERTGSSDSVEEIYHPNAESEGLVEDGAVQSAKA